MFDNVFKGVKGLISKKQKPTQEEVEQELNDEKIQKEQEIKDFTIKENYDFIIGKEIDLDKAFEDGGEIFKDFEKTILAFTVARPTGAEKLLKPHLDFTLDFLRGDTLPDIDKNLSSYILASILVDYKEDHSTDVDGIYSLAKAVTLYMASMFNKIENLNGEMADKIIENTTEIFRKYITKAALVALYKKDLENRKKLDEFIDRILNREVDYSSVDTEELGKLLGRPLTELSDDDRRYVVNELLRRYSIKNPKFEEDLFLIRALDHDITRVAFKIMDPENEFIDHKKLDEHFAQKKQFSKKSKN